MRTTIRSSSVAVGLAALLATPAVAAAQSGFGSIAGGAYLHPTVDASYNAQASIGWRFSRRIEARLDWFTGTWGERYAPGVCGAVHYQTCYPPNSGWGLAGSGVVNMRAARGPRAYLIGGVGSYHFNEYDETAFGLSGGIGVTARVRGRLRVVVETRYHHIVDGRDWLRDVMPVTLGIQF